MPSEDLVRVPGSGGALAAKHRIWLAPGHLLLVETSGYQESYRRIELADIQALSLRHTRTMMVRAAVSGGILLLLGVLMATTGPGTIIALGILAAPILILLVADLVLGPTCKLHLRTPVQIVELPSLGRVRRARRFIDRLVPLIAQVQGTLPVEELQRRLGEMESVPGAPAPVATSSASR